MNKRHLHHLWTKLRWVKPWYFLALAISSAVICIFALRANNQHMSQLRQEVYQADKNNTDVQAPLKRLQAYVTSHMNTNLNAGQNAVYPPIQLKYTYERLVKAQADQLAQTNTQLYSTAQAVCEQQNPSSFGGGSRIPCIAQYVQSHSSVGQLPTIPDALYKFAFVTPVWSPDLAGLSLVAAILAGLLFLAALAAKFWFHRNV